MSKARQAAFTALFIAISVVLTRFASVRVAIAGVEGIRIGFGSLPNIMAGILLGPVYGAISGAFSDIIGFVLSPMGGYMPHFTVSAGVMGALPGLVLVLLRKARLSRRIPEWFETVLAVGTGVIVVSWGLTPYFLNTLYGLPRAAIMLPRIVAALIEIPAYSVIIRSVSVSYVRLTARNKPA